MTLSQQHLADSDFKNALALSGIAHGLVVVLLIFRAVFLPSEPIEIRNAIQVDVVGLPDKIMTPAKPEEPKPAPALPPKVETEAPATPPPKIVEKPKAKTVDLQKKAMDRLKALEAIDKLKIDQAAQKEKTKAPTAKGNTLSAGDSPTGLSKIQFDEYLTNVRARILENFHLPQWLADANLHAQAIAMIDENGLVIRREIVKSSGNDIFDSMVLEAIEKSSPFSAPPPSLKSILQYRGVVFRFPD